MPASWFDSPALRRLADVVRLLALASAAAAYFWVDGSSGVRFLVVTAILVAVRWFGLVTLFDALLCLTAVVSTWAAALDWYVTIVWVDEVMHLVAVGVLAAACYLPLSRSGALPGLSALSRGEHRVPVVLMVSMVGFTLASFWEFIEWIGEQLSPSTIHVGYDDTISDLALGGLGAAVAGVLIALSARALVRAQARVSARS
ncbi:MAG TPA: hypothetical protein VFK34_09310 [Marmoricola sp.]|nr:hypothetical protein [Marmoricola sp.]